MKKIVLLGFSSAMLFLCGCRTQIVTLDVIPADARVIANGCEYNNQSPIFIEANTGQQLVITAYKEGYRDKLYVVDYSLSTLGKIEAWTAVLVIPGLGLFFDNAWKLNENNITLTLEPITPEARAEALKASPRMVPVKGANIHPDHTTNPQAKKAFNEL